MISELDESIRRVLIEEGGLDPAEIDIRFEIPDRDWAASISRPTVNCYLFDIHENRQLRGAGWYVEGNGRQARTRRPPMRINLSYLITAWTKAVEDEHRLLWQVLATLAHFPEFPKAKLQGALAEIEGEIPTMIAQPDGGPLRSPGEFWSALENKLKPSINYVVTLPLDTMIGTVAPFVLTPLTLRSFNFGGDGAAGGAAAGAGGAGAAGSGAGGAGAAGAGGDGAAPAGLARAAGGALRGPGGDFTITGAVRDAGGNIIKAARVYFLGGSRRIGYRSSIGTTAGFVAFGRRDGPGHGRGDGLDQSVITNCEGGFTLYAVPPGIHRVAIQLPGQPLRQRELTVPAESYDLILDDVPAAAPAPAPPSPAPEPPAPAPRRRRSTD
jgi:hypothetical protein